MSLTEWLKAQWLKAHKTSRQEIANLMGVADRDLRDCQAKGLSDDGRLAIAYNAASILLAHNHPSGDPTPSRDDIAITQEAPNYSMEYHGNETL